VENFDYLFPDVDEWKCCSVRWMCRMKLRTDVLAWRCVLMKTQLAAIYETNCIECSQYG